MIEVLWDTRHLYDAPQKGSSPLKELRRAEKNLDALHVKTLRVPPAMLEVEEEAVQAKATVEAVVEVEVAAVVEEEVAAVVEEEVVEEVAEVVMTTGMTM